MKKIITVIKKVVLSICILYTINLFIESTGVLLPINYVSVSIVSLLGIPSIIGLLVIYYFI